MTRRAGINRSPKMVTVAKKAIQFSTLSEEFAFCAVHDGDAFLLSCVDHFNMRPFSLYETEVALLLEMYIAGIFATLIPLGFGDLAAAMAANTRSIFSAWKVQNDVNNDRVDLIMGAVEQQIVAASGPNRIRDLKRKLQNAKEGMEPGKRRNTGFNHARALACVREDWYADHPLVPRPKFTDIDFEQTFGVTRTHIEEIILPACTRHRPEIFCTSANAAKKESIMPIVKILNALKIARFGVSMHCFKDYFQMGETSARYAFYALMDSLTNDLAVSSKYRRVMTRADLARVMAMHHDQHGVNGFAFSIDCWHLHWKNCPSAWKGQLEGKEGMATLVMEAGIDFNLWIWHSMFGFPGTMNDIQIWEQSKHYLSIISGEWANFVDPVEPFRIGNMMTTKAFFPVDGIYPLLTRFCKTITVPQNPAQTKYAAWQVAVRKDVERGFGVLGSKFRILIRPCEFHQPSQIANMVYGCISLHNMMVEHRMSLGEVESADLYKISDSLNRAIHEKTNVWLQDPIETGEDDTIRDNNNNNSNNATGILDPREYQVRGPLGAVILSQLHSNLIPENDLANAHEHYELQSAICTELATSS